jgi:hypothetical protein
MKGDRCGGSFGTATWRQNPYVTIRYAGEKEEFSLKRATMSKSRLDSGTRRPSHAHAEPEIDITVAVAEGGELPATLSVHVVRNSAEAAAAGARMLLVPGYEVIASSDISQDLPHASFKLPPTDDSRPVFVVPSAARGEEGPLTIVVEASNPVNVTEVAEADRDLWEYTWDTELEWSDQMPYRKNKGGPRKNGIAPELSWYHNPQFMVRLKSKMQKEEEEEKARLAGAVGLLASFGFAQSEGDQRPITRESGVTEASGSSSEDKARGFTLNLHGVGDFHVDIDDMESAEWFVTGEVLEKDGILFTTEVAHAVANRANRKVAIDLGAREVVTSRLRQMLGKDLSDEVKISRQEFCSFIELLIEDKETAKILRQDFGVDLVGLVSSADAIFQDQKYIDEGLPLPDFMDLVHPTDAQSSPSSKNKNFALRWDHSSVVQDFSENDVLILRLWKGSNVENGTLCGEVDLPFGSFGDGSLKSKSALSLMDVSRAHARASGIHGDKAVFANMYVEIVMLDEARSQLASQEGVSTKTATLHRGPSCHSNMFGDMLNAQSQAPLLQVRLLPMMRTRRCPLQPTL